MPYRAVPQHSFAPCRAATAGWWACRCSRRGRCSGLPDTRLAEWLIEHGIGETRAVLIEHGQIVEAIVERDDTGLRAGAVSEGRLTAILVQAKRRIVTLSAGHDPLIEPLPPALPEGAPPTVEETRPANPTQATSRKSPA